MNSWFLLCAVANLIPEISTLTYLGCTPRCLVEWNLLGHVARSPWPYERERWLRPQADVSGVRELFSPRITLVISSILVSRV